MNIFHSNTGTKPDRTRIYYQTDSSDTSISTDIGIEFINPTEISASYRSEIRSHGAQSESNQQYSETVREDMTITLYIDRSGEQSITGELLPAATCIVDPSLTLKRNTFSLILRDFPFEFV